MERRSNWDAMSRMDWTSSATSSATVDRTPSYTPLLESVAERKPGSSLERKRGKGIGRTDLESVA
jgi:hypothetical protein